MLLVISQCAHADKQPIANRYRKDHPERKNAFAEVKSRRSEKEDDRYGDEHPHRFRTTAARKQPRAERSCERRAVASRVMFESGHLRMHGMRCCHQYRKRGKRQYDNPRLMTRNQKHEYRLYSFHLLSGPVFSAAYRIRSSFLRCKIFLAVLPICPGYRFATSFRTSSGTTSPPTASQPRTA